MTREEKAKIVEEVQMQMCDKYCKFPYQESEDRLNDICAQCPLNKLEELKK